MNIAYCSLLLPEDKKLVERSKERLSGISLHKFTRAIINGIEDNIDEPMKIFNIINTINYPKFPDLVFPTEKWHHRKGSDDWHIGYINLIGIKYITQFLGLYRKLDRWIRQTKEQQHIICVHHIYFPSMLAACMLKCKYKKKVTLCLITGDMNGRYGLVSQYTPNLKQLLLKIIENQIDQMAKRFDCFVFATKNMAHAFGVEDKPFVVLECAYLLPEYTSQASVVYKKSNSQKIIFYAGALREEYGISHLLRAFVMIDNSNYHLWLAGDGNAVHTVKEYQKRYSNIEYLGFLTPQEVDIRQQQSTVLISPRTSQYEYVKYSFPSKIMECLASGIPYIAHRLPCDPPEYADHIQYADGETDEALKNKIIQICSLTEMERNLMGEKARNFINEEKNPSVMTKRIVTMWNYMLKA